MLTQKWKNPIFFHFRKFYGQTQVQNFQQQSRRKLGQMKHPIDHPLVRKSDDKQTEPPFKIDCLYLQILFIETNFSQ